MKLHIKNKLRLRDVQREFSKYFQNLRLEFYNLPHEKYINAVFRTKLSPDTIVGYCRDIDREGSLVICGEERVHELERELSLCFGLHAQVYKQDGNKLLDITSFENESLANQNRSAA